MVNDSHVARPGIWKVRMWKQGDDLLGKVGL